MVMVVVVVVIYERTCERSKKCVEVVGKCSS
jgi:hypothetical protein